MNRLYGKYEGWSGSVASGRPGVGIPPAPDTVEQWQQTIEPFLRPLENWVRRHPGLSLAVAVSAGICIGWLVKRR
jgi:hypothetical protein